MALPNTFAAVTSATGAQLDANFNADGKLGVIPCAVSGQNIITMTPTAGISPTVSVLANYLRFSGVVVTTNNAAVTIAIGALAALNAYKDGPAGPVALSGGELIAGCAFTAIYNSALASGAGGFHIYTSTAFAGGTISGSLANVVLSGGTLVVTGGSLGATLTSALLTGNSLTINALNLNASLASIQQMRVGTLATLATMTRMVTAQATVAFSVTSANAVQDQTFALPNAQIGDVVALGLFTTVPSGAGFTGFMLAAGTVNLRLVNPAVATLGAATVTLRATAMGFA